MRCTPLLLLVALAACKRGTPTAPAPLLGSGAPGMIQIHTARASNLASLAAQRRDQRAQDDASQAVRDGITQAFSAARSQYAAMPQLDFDAHVKTVADAAAGTVTTMMVVTRTCYLFSRGRDPAIPGNDCYAALLVGEVPQADFFGAIEKAIAGKTFSIEPIRKLTLFRGGETMYLR